MIDSMKKIFAVVFLTMLIWTWAYLSLETDISLFGSFEIAKEANPGLLIQFADSPEPEKVVVKVNYKGSPTKVSELRKRHQTNKERLDFYYDPKEFGHEKGGRYSIDMFSFVREESGKRNIALNLVSTEPEKIQVSVEKLVNKQLSIRCVDENGVDLSYGTLEPSKVNIFVREHYDGPATIILTPQQIQTAQTFPIEVKPFVELGIGGERRQSEEFVTLTLPVTEPLQQHTLNTKVGLIINERLESEYKVELINSKDFTTSTILATDEAFEAYKTMRYHILVEIRDEDTNEIYQQTGVERNIIYNFPLDFYKRGQIESQPMEFPLKAKIKLTPLASNPGQL